MQSNKSPGRDGLPDEIYKLFWKEIPPYLLNALNYAYRNGRLAIIRGNEWSLRAFASMPSTAIFLRARAEIKNLLCELASNAKIWGARASEHSFKFCEQIEQR